MKALSFRQPWAELVLQGQKTLDLRTYLTHYRGPLAIHASQKIEREACTQHGLDPDQLSTGGIIGIVNLVDVIPLDETEYNRRRAEHLAGRSFREGMYGWLLQDPHRLPEMVPAPGRMSLFNVDLELSALEVSSPNHRPELDHPTPTPARDRRQTPERSRTSRPVSRSRQPAVPYTANTSDLPFELKVALDHAATTSYILTLRQRLVHPPEAQQSFFGHSPAQMTTIVTLGGDSLRAISDHVLDALREAGYKATDLSPRRRSPFYLPEAVGVRLGLVFLAVKPLSKPDRIEAISHGIRQMTLEEAYYWYSKCTATATAERAQKALRVLLAAE